MVNKIYKNYYKDNGFIKLIVNKFSLIDFLVIIFVLLIEISGIIFYMYKSDDSNKYIFLISFIILSISILYMLNIFTKKALKEYYNIESFDFIANFEEMHVYRETQLKKFLENNFINREKKICYEIIYDGIEEEIKERRSPQILNGAIVTAILGPLWIQFLNSLFQKYTSSIEEAIAYFSTILIFVVYLISIYCMVTSNLQEIIHAKYFRWKDLKKVIKNIEFVENNKKSSLVLTTNN